MGPKEICRRTRRLAQRAQKSQSESERKSESVRCLFEFHSGVQQARRSWRKMTMGEYLVERFLRQRYLGKRYPRQRCPRETYPTERYLR